MNNYANNEYDTIVVGSGPGGATVAKELTQNSQKVLMLEWGDYNPVTGSKAQTVKNTGMPMQSMLFTHNMVGLVRGLTTGGSSIYYYATCFEPPLDMLKNYGIDISREVDETRSELPNSPLEDDLVGPMTNRIMDSAQDLGFDWNKLPKFIYQDRCRPQCWRCNYGCPHGAKWNARMFVDQAFKKGMQIVNRARVKRVIMENNQATGVAYTKNFMEYHAHAPKVIIAAGGIGSPVILKNSGIKEAGGDFFFDPLIAVFGEAKDIRGGSEIPMSSGAHMVEDGYVMTDMTIPETMYRGFSAQKGRLDRLFAHKKTLSIMVKERDRLGGHLTDKGGVRKKLAPGDVKALKHGKERAKKILKNAGAKNIFSSWYVAAHPGGTIKTNHLLDSDLQTEVENLYVCDCSVIPESFGLPPTMTLIGLGKRLAKHLAKQEKTSKQSNVYSAA